MAEKLEVYVSNFYSGAKIKILDKNEKGKLNTHYQKYNKNISLHMIVKKLGVYETGSNIYTYIPRMANYEFSPSFEKSLTNQLNNN